MNIEAVSTGQSVRINEEGQVPSSPPTSAPENRHPPEKDRRVDRDRYQGPDKPEPRGSGNRADEMEEQVKELNSKLYKLNQKLLFKVDKRIDRNYISIIDKKTRETIKEFPPEKIRDFMATFSKLNEASGNGEALYNILVNLEV